MNTKTKSEGSLPSYVWQFLLLLLALFWALLTNASAQAPTEVNKVAEGGSLVISAVSDGSLPISFRWMKDGVEVGTGNPFTIASFTPTKVGIYYAIATNELGSAESNRMGVELAPVVPPPVTPQPPVTPPPVTPPPVTPPPVTPPPVGAAPVITKQPVLPSTPIYWTGSFTFTAEVTSATPVTYQWRRNGTAWGGWTEPSLSIGSLTSNDTGTYILTITNEAGSVTTNPLFVDVVLKPTAPPPPTVQPPTGVQVTVKKV